MDQKLIINRNIVDQYDEQDILCIMCEKEIRDCAKCDKKKELDRQVESRR